MASPRRVEEGMLRQGPDFLRTAAGPGQFAGRTTLNSGTATVVVSTAVVNSDSFFRLAEVGVPGVGSNSGGHVVINSIVSGVCFTLARATGVASPVNATISWEIVRTGAR